MQCGRATVPTHRCHVVTVGATTGLDAEELDFLRDLPLPLQVVAVPMTTAASQRLNTVELVQQASDEALAGRTNRLAAIDAHSKDSSECTACVPHKQHATKARNLEVRSARPVR